MDEELLSQLAANAGMGADLARVQAQLLRAKAVRDQAQRPSIRTSPGGAALGALARGIGAVRADRMEQPALAEQADLDARSKLLRQKVSGAVQQLPSLAPQVDPQTGAYAPIDPAAVERHRALGNALAAQGDKGYADLGGKLSGDASKALEGSIKAANARALGMVEVPGLGWLPKSVYETMVKDRTARDTSKTFDMTPIPGAPGMYLHKDLHTGQSRVVGDLILGPDGKPVGGGKGGRPQLQRVHNDATGQDEIRMLVDGVWYPTTLAPDTFNAPPAAPATPPAPGAPPAPVQPGAPQPQVAKPPQKSLPKGEADTLEEDRKLLDRLRALRTSFKDSYAGQPLTGRAKTWMGRTLGKEMGGENNYQQSLWWADFRKMVENIERKKTAGVAVTPMEKALFDAAQRIREGVEPQDIKAEFDRSIAEMEKLSTARATARKAEGYNPAAVGALTGQTAEPSVDDLLRKYGGQ